MKVLFVEDEPLHFIFWAERLPKNIEIIQAFSIGEAREKFEKNPDFAAIVVDACVPGSWPNTHNLVSDFRETFSGPMIAISHLEPFRRKLLQYGCDHEAEKAEIPEKLLEVIGAIPEPANK
jgi:hypothetical protein